MNDKYPTNQPEEISAHGQEPRDTNDHPDDLRGPSENDFQDPEQLFRALKAIPTQDLVDLHNALSDELAKNKQAVKKIYEASNRDISDNPNFNYKLGQVTGFQIALGGLEAFLRLRGAEQSGELDEILLLDDFQEG